MVQGDLVAVLEAVAEVDKLFICKIMDSVYQPIALLLVQGARKIYQDHRLHSMPLQQEEVGKVTEETVAQEAVEAEVV